MTRYGMALINGELTCSADVSQGARWLIRGSQEATSKYPAGLYEYAILHENGIQPVIFKDHLFMLSLLQQGCKLGDPRSHVKCAQGYDQGLWGLIYSPRDAYSHYLRAAKKNNPEAMYRTALHLSGLASKVVPPNPSLAFEYASKAAMRGHRNAMALLGKFYYKGYGTPIDKSKAVIWLQKAEGERAAPRKSCTIL